MLIIDLKWRDQSIDKRQKIVVGCLRKIIQRQFSSIKLLNGSSYVKNLLRSSATIGFGNDDAY